MTRRLWIDSMAVPWIVSYPNATTLNNILDVSYFVFGTEKKLILIKLPRCILIPHNNNNNIKGKKRKKNQRHLSLQPNEPWSFGRSNDIIHLNLVHRLKLLETICGYIEGASGRSSEQASKQEKWNKRASTHEGEKKISKFYKQPFFHFVSERRVRRKK